VTDSWRDDDVIVKHLSYESSTVKEALIHALTMIPSAGSERGERHGSDGDKEMTNRVQRGGENTQTPLRSREKRGRSNLVGQKRHRHIGRKTSRCKV